MGRKWSEDERRSSLDVVDDEFAGGGRGSGCILGANLERSSRIGGGATCRSLVALCGEGSPEKDWEKEGVSGEIT